MRSNKWSGLILSLILFGVGWVFGANVQANRELPEVNRLLYVGLFAIFSFGGFVAGGVWLAQRITVIIENNAKAGVAGAREIWTIRKEMIQMMSHFNDKQIEIMANPRIFIDVIPGDPPVGPLYQIRLPGGDVSMEFMEEFLRLSTDTDLPEVRQWSGGTYKRDAAQNITAYFVSKGYALGAAGNRSATWVNKTLALQSLGFLPIEEYADGE